jgi:hypothetical protein
MSSATGGQLVFNYNTFLQRGLNLLDCADLPTARANLGISSANGLNIGSGLIPSGTTFNFSAPVNLSVNSSTTGTASTIAQYDASGSLTTSGYVNVGYGTVPTTSILNFNSGTTGALASITRGSGTNGALTITNSGSGGLVLGTTSLNGGFSADTISTSGVLNVAYGTTPVASTISLYSGTTSALGSLSRSTGTNGGMLLTNTGTGGITVNGSLLSFVSSGIVSSVSATSTSVTSASGTTVGLTAGVTGTTSLTVNSTGSAGAGNQALAVSGGATIDTLSGGCISDNAGTSSTTAASQKALAKYLPLGQPSWSLYQSAVAMSTSSNPTGLQLFAPGTQTASNRSITNNGGNITPSVQGRYLVTFTGQVNGNGQVSLYLTNNDGGAAGTSYTLWNATATNANVSGSFLWDFTGTSTSLNYAAVVTTANSGTFTINWGSFVGILIG